MIMLGNGQHTATENGPWASDEVTVTNRSGRRASLRIVQPTGAFVATNAWDASGRWSVVGGTAGTFTYGYPAPTLSGPAWTLPTSLTLPSAPRGFGEAALPVNESGVAAALRHRSPGIVSGRRAGRFTQGGRTHWRGRFPWSSRASS